MSDETPIPKAPSGLTARSRRLWKAVLDEHELSAAELEVLRCALVALDRADQAAADIAEHGVTLPDRYGGRKANPAADVEARNRTMFARFVAQLGVKLTDEEPPTPASMRASRAANVRWIRERAGHVPTAS